MKIERSWKSKTGFEKSKIIDEKTAKREMAYAHGDNAIRKLKKEKSLTTQWAQYTVSE